MGKFVMGGAGVWRPWVWTTGTLKTMIFLSHESIHEKVCLCKSPVCSTGDSASMTSKRLNRLRVTADYRRYPTTSLWITGDGETLSGNGHPWSSFHRKVVRSRGAKPLYAPPREKAPFINSRPSNDPTAREDRLPFRKKRKHHND